MRGVWQRCCLKHNTNMIVFTAEVTSFQLSNVIIRSNEERNTFEPRLTVKEKTALSQSILIAAEEKYPELCKKDGEFRPVVCFAQPSISPKQSVPIIVPGWEGDKLVARDASVGELAGLGYVAHTKGEFNLTVDLILRHPETSILCYCMVVHTEVADCTPRYAPTLESPFWYEAVRFGVEEKTLREFVDKY